MTQEDNIEPGDSASANGDAAAEGDNNVPDENASGSSAAVPRRPRRTEPYFGEAWAADDGLILNLPIFRGCTSLFKRLLLRSIREYEYHDVGKETWFDEDYDEICTLENLDKNRLPPLKLEFLGVKVEPDEYICKGGDYDTKLVVVISGTVEKLVGDAPQGGLVVVRTLQRGDSEGITEFLGVGAEQRTCALRGGPDGARVRYVTRQALQQLLAEKVVDEDVEQPEDPQDPRIMKNRWPQEVAYFDELGLERIDSLNHKASRELLIWTPGPVGSPDEHLDFLTLKGQGVFMIDKGMGTTVSGPLPEGIEDRYYFDGQTVLKRGYKGDCCILILRGQIEAIVPDGCSGQCLPRIYEPLDPDTTESWLGDGRDCGTGYVPPPPEEVVVTRSRTNSASDDDEVGSIKPPSIKPEDLIQEITDKEIAMVALVAPQNLKRAMAHLRKWAKDDPSGPNKREDAKLTLDHMTTTDWRWHWDDRACLIVFEVLQHAKLLTPHGYELWEEVDEHLNPPPEDPPPEPQSLIKPGQQIGRLALMGVPIVFSGDVKAKGPVLVAILHRSVLLKALTNCEEIEMFLPKGLTRMERVDAVKKLPARKSEAQFDRPSHLGPVTGPPLHSEVAQAAEPLAGTFGAYKSATGHYKDVPAADALEWVLLRALKSYALIWDLIFDAPPRLLDELVRAWEPRWLLPGETIVVDEEPDADFIFVVVHGSCVVTLESREIDHVGQGSVQGAAQLLGLNDWTRSVTIDAECNGEAMLQVLRRTKLVEMLSGHPLPKVRLKAVEDSLQEGKGADWHILKNIPAFGSCAYQPFLSRLYKDADVRLHCAGENVAQAGDTAAAMIVVLAGTIRCEMPQTLFYVELHGGEWCFQDNILGNATEMSHDVVAVTNVLVVVLYRHAMQNAMSAHPETRKPILFNETWRKDPDVPMPSITILPVFAKLPEVLIADLVEECRHVYYRPGSIILQPGSQLEDDALLFILRGEFKVKTMGIETRIIPAGGCVGLHQFMGLNPPPVTVTIESTQACDCIMVQRSTMQKALDDELLEDDMLPYTGAVSVLEGGEILDAFGFPIGDGSVKNCPNCIQESEVFRACSEHFVSQIPDLVEERAFWPGEKIYNQFDPGDFMYFVRAGRVRVEVLGKKEPDILDAGCTLGEMAVLDQVPSYCETVTAETHVWVRALHKKLLRRSLSSFPEEEKRMMGQARGGGVSLM
mmetsp:Transcript_19636/g.34765  ORF Transcript_19636/g.34765 Transcript_19636/m.34765 type:complete len:1205 (-) Transcript_19636:138-3752(-)